MSYELKIEPPAAGLPSDTHLTIEAEGNRAAAVHFVVEDLGHQHEDALAGLDVFDALTQIIAQGWADPVARSLAFALALERQRITPPRRVQSLRQIAAELERAGRHLSVVAAILDTAGARGWGERLAPAIQLLAQAQAAAYPDAGVSQISIGGAAEVGDADAMVDAVTHAEGQLRRLLERLIHDRAVLARLVGVGLLTREDAVSFGAVGPFARASEVALDVRHSAPYAAYATTEDERVTPLVQSGGDVFARLVVLLLETLTALQLVRQAVGELAAEVRTTVKAKLRRVIPSAGDLISRVEAPGGELLCYLRLGDDGRIAGLRWRSPTQANMPLVPQLLSGQELADVPLIMLSAYL